MKKMTTTNGEVKKSIKLFVIFLFVCSCLGVTFIFCSSFDFKHEERRKNVWRLKINNMTGRILENMFMHFSIKHLSWLFFFVVEDDFSSVDMCCLFLYVSLKKQWKPESKHPRGWYWVCDFSFNKIKTNCDTFYGDFWEKKFRGFPQKKNLSETKPT